MDKNKIIQAATKFVQKGQFDKAIAEYQKILKEDPKDVRILLKVGELQQKKGDNGPAAKTLLAVAESYSGDGFFLKAVAVYKQVLKLDPNLVEVNLKLAELYQQLGLMSDAMAQFQLVANHHERLGNGGASLEVLQRMVDLDPENVASRIKLAELFARDGRNGEAVGEFRKAADYLKSNNRVDDFLKVGERIVFLDPNDVPLTRELAQVYLAKGDTKRALAKLQNCFKADPRDIETLHMLAQAFKDLGQLTKTVSVYKELAKIFSEADRFDEEKATWRKVLEIAPDDADARTALAPKRVQPLGPGPDEFPMAQPPRPNVAVSAPPMPSGPPPGARPAAGPPPGAQRGVSAATPGPKGGRDAIPKLLTETDVYVKYGLQDKALEHLKKIFGLDPDNVDAHEKAHNLFSASGNYQAAQEELITLARLCEQQGQLERGRVHFAKLLEQAPHLPEVAELVAAYGAAPPPPEAADDAILVEASDDEVLVADGEDESLLAPPEPSAGDEIVLDAGDAAVDDLSLEVPGDGDVDAALAAAADAAAEELDDAVSLDASAGEEISFEGGIDLEVPEDDVEVRGPPLADADDAALEAAVSAAGSDDDAGFSLDADAGEELSLDAEPVIEDEPELAPQVEDELLGGAEAELSFGADDDVAPPAFEEDAPIASFDDEETTDGGRTDSEVHELPTQMMAAGAIPELAQMRAQWKEEQEASQDLPYEPPDLDAPLDDDLHAELDAPTLPGIPAGGGRHTAPTAVGPSPLARAAPEPEPEPEAAAEENPWGLEPEDLEEIATELEEADFLASQELWDEAEEALRSILFRAPGHPVAEAKLAVVLAKGEAPAAEPAAAPAADDEGRFDLGAELAEELSGEPPPAVDEFQYSAEDVFEEFKKGVQRAVRPEDSQTHFDLGIAYKEMSLLRDAIGEFETALAGCRGQAREVDCLNMIGIIRIDLGEIREAAESFREALACPQITPDVQKAIHFELASTYEKLERPGEALHFYARVAKVDGAFRDVKKHVARLEAEGVEEKVEEAPRKGGNGSAAHGHGAEDNGPGKPPGAAPGKSRKIGYV